MTSFTPHVAHMNCCSGMPAPGRNSPQVPLPLVTIIGQRGPLHSVRLVDSSQMCMCLLWIYTFERLRRDQPQNGIFVCVFTRVCMNMCVCVCVWEQVGLCRAFGLEQMVQMSIVFAEAVMAVCSCPVMISVALTYSRGRCISHMPLTKHLADIVHTCQLFVSLMKTDLSFPLV